MTKFVSLTAHDRHCADTMYPVIELSSVFAGHGLRRRTRRKANDQKLNENSYGLGTPALDHARAGAKVTREGAPAYP